MGWYGPRGACGCCAVCTCDGEPLGQLYVTVSGVTMNATPVLDECLGARFGQTIDETWYNGVTFLFNLEWTQSEFEANNPNEFDLFGFAGQCTQQTGLWVCTQVLPPPDPEEFFVWSIGVQLVVSGSKLTVYVTLGCAFDEKGSGQSYDDAFNDGVNQTAVSNVQIWMEYDSLCPVGTPTEVFRANVGDSGAFDFTGATVGLVWA